MLKICIDITAHYKKLVVKPTLTRVIDKEPERQTIKFVMDQKHITTNLNAQILFDSKTLDNTAFAKKYIKPIITTLIIVVVTLVLLIALLIANKLWGSPFINALFTSFSKKQLTKLKKHEENKKNKKHTDDREQKQSTREKLKNVQEKIEKELEECELKFNLSQSMQTLPNERIRFEMARRNANITSPKSYPRILPLPTNEVIPNSYLSAASTPTYETINPLHRPAITHQIQNITIPDIHTTFNPANPNIQKQTNLPTGESV